MLGGIGSLNMICVFGLSSIIASNVIFLKVYVTHIVTLTANASAKTLTIFKPGNVIVSTGRLLNILN